MSSSFCRSSVCFAIGALLAAPSFAQSGSRARAHDFSNESLISPPRSSWPTNGGNFYNQRYSPLTAINRENVGKLKGVWRARLRGSGAAPQYSGEAQPLVYDGTAYVSTGADDVFARLDRNRRNIMAIHGEPRPEHNIGLLWLDEPRRRNQRR